jgi:hypothetical protein
MDQSVDDREGMVILKLPINFGGGGGGLPHPTPLRQVETIVARGGEGEVSKFNCFFRPISTQPTWGGGGGLRGQYTKEEEVK